MNTLNVSAMQKFGTWRNVSVDPSRAESMTLVMRSTSFLLRVAVGR
jgi:hypothetical protein